MSNLETPASKPMKTFTIVAFILTFFVISALGQGEFDYGKPSDLKGLTKIYIDTMGDLKENERIVSRLNKAKISTIQIVEDSDDAEIVLMFGGDDFTVTSGANSNTIGGSTSTVVTRVNLLLGEGRVFVLPKEGSKLLLIMRVKNTQQTKLEKRPVTKFVEDFIKVYKKVNGLTD